MAILKPQMRGIVLASKIKPNLFTTGDISNVYWAKEQSTASSGFAGPTGSLTAQRMLETTANNQHLVTANLNNTVKPAIIKKLKFTGLVKYLGRDIIRLGIFNGGFGAGYMIYFNVATGVVDSHNPAGAFSAANIAISPKDNGYYMISAEFTTDAQAGAYVSLMSAISASTQSYVGNVNTGFYCQDLYIQDIT